ncbi:gliding motility protein GldL [Polluticoccus soli]|uniref:type IX secretion system motor protein PorL/GldL n=1 Tax=Polluticoccus soli TaxID=3034150 RepID=UPI0023E22E47|nr:gliding motility protein GldL [Flavipsychrobacter sp. JY13-12]
MNSIQLFFETKQGKYFKNLIIGMGAAVVLMGALFKIQHWPGAGIMLTAGMMTEAFIFAMLGLLPPHKDYYWERFYPGIDENPHVEAYRKGVKFDSSAGKSSPSASLDKMMEDAKITPANIRKLGDNFERFGLVVEQIKDISDVTAATNQYSSSAREAATALSEMKNTFVGASNTMASFNSAADETARFHEQVQVLSRNLGSLNQIYEVELQDANNHLKAMNKFYSNLVNASDAMASSATDAVAAKEQIALLSKNLTVLNQIYGNMLSAMQGR